MRHKYDTRGIILARSPLGEANALVTILTPQLGIVRARAQGVRQSGAKLAAALATFSESELVLVRGREGWRVTGAVLDTQRPPLSHAARERAARVNGLILRLVVGEVEEAELFALVQGFMRALAAAPETDCEMIELLAVLRLLRVCGVDAGEPVGEASDYSSSLLDRVRDSRKDYLARVNQGIAASGL